MVYGQDRLLSYGDESYTYTRTGELASRARSGLTTRFEHDGLGNLTAVVLPTGDRIDYVLDAMNRRIGVRRNGVLVQGFLYQNGINPVAELDGANNVIAQFVYGSQPNVPDYMVKGGVTYRFVTDHLGSVRLVVNAASGVPAQRIEYDEYGQTLSDDNPGFQPFGYAGGLVDRDTRLIHFGARDYDPYVGRWIERDPLLFGGSSSNLYSYVNGDPVSYIDPTGEKIYVCWHDVAGTWMMHAFIEIVPDDGSPRFTIGAGPDDLFYNKSNGFPLLAGINRRHDVNDPKDGCILLMLPAGMTESQMITRLVRLMENYMRKEPLPYELVPYPSALGYNSNSFAHGLLDAAGYAIPTIPASVPHWDNPVPRKYFDP